MKIVRYYTPVGTFGELLLPEFRCLTVERPWLDNRPWVSCIPEGTYPLYPTRYHRGGYDTLLIGEVPGRSQIKIHRGNLPDDVYGCVAVGKTFGCVGGQWAVLSSKDAFAEFWEVWEDLEEPPKTVEITSSPSPSTTST